MDWASIKVFVVICFTSASLWGALPISANDVCKCNSTVLTCAVAVELVDDKSVVSNGTRVKPLKGVTATCLNRNLWKDNADVTDLLSRRWNDKSCRATAASFAVQQGFSEKNLARLSCSVLSKSSPLDVDFVDRLFNSSNKHLTEIRRVNLLTLKKQLDELRYEVETVLVLLSTFDRLSPCDCEQEVLLRWLQGNIATQDSSCNTEGSQLLASLTIQGDNCGLLHQPLHGSLTCTSTGDDGKGEHCTVQCSHGYAIKGSSSAVQVCHPAVGWIPSRLQCDPIDCKHPLMPDHGLFSCNSTLLYGTCTLSCSPGYKLSGKAVRQCLPSGLWSKRISLCLSTCPPGYSVFSKTGHCYKYFDDLFTWPDARQKCINDGGDLVSIGNQEEERFVQSLVKVHDQADGVWIGFNDIAFENSWAWSDGSPVTYTNWDKGEQDSSGEQDDSSGEQNKDCGHIYGQNFGGSGIGSTWNDDSCQSMMLHYVCKI
eukprot:m.209853 g.209853  ORF g.209853 m.209853 type:complete len:484 (+) comp39729_c0_seq9:143-1594(+)